MAIAFAVASSADDAMTPAALDDDSTQFLEKAASAGKLEIESGRLAGRSATNPKLREFGNLMMSDHSMLDQQIKALAATKGVTLPAAMADDHQKALDELREAKRGRAFDDEFRNLMVQSHEEAVSLFDRTARDAKDPEVKAFAAKILPKLQEHERAAKALPKN
jgi:putative membrane protein